MIAEMGKWFLVGWKKGNVLARFLDYFRTRKIRLDLIIMGDVHGFCFRERLKAMADQFRLGGYAENKINWQGPEKHQVDVVLEGNKEKVGKVYDWIRQEGLSEKESGSIKIRWMSIKWLPCTGEFKRGGFKTG